MAVQRNTEFRSISTIPYVEVSRDGELRYQHGKRQFRLNGMEERPERFLKHSDGSPMSIQYMIHLVFPDIPMRYTPTR